MGRPTRAVNRVERGRLGFHLSPVPSSDAAVSAMKPPTRPSSRRCPEGLGVDDAQRPLFPPHPLSSFAAPRLRAGDAVVCAFAPG